jgi:hypothetical protein
MDSVSPNPKKLKKQKKNLLASCYRLAVRAADIVVKQTNKIRETWAKTNSLASMNKIYIVKICYVYNVSETKTYRE